MNTGNRHTRERSMFRHRQTFLSALLTLGLFVSTALADQTEAGANESGRSDLNPGKVMLRKMGVDVSLWQDVTNRSRLGPEDRELFYQVLNAVGQIDPVVLQKRARENLALLRRGWREELAELQQQTPSTTAGSKAKVSHESTAGQPPPVDARKRRAELQKMLAAADEGRFSVVPLFNDPASQHGQLVSLRGTAIRAIKIAVADPLDASANRDIRERYGIDHYYEIEIVTTDSQNNPIVFCVRRLPSGFPTGERINQPVQITGFFFKSWSYASQRTGGSISKADGQQGRLRQVAPILIGSEPVMVQVARPNQFGVLGMVAGGVFVAVLLAIWLGIWRVSRSDRKFRSTLSPGTLTEIDTERDY